MMKQIFIVLLLAFAVQSCKKEENKAVAAPKIYSQLEKAKWFIGHWDNTVADAHFVEVWKQKNDSALVGKSTVKIKDDIVFSEEVDIMQRNDSLFYIVSVKDQNEAKPVSFYMTKATKNEVVFENPKHDYPTKITYTKFTNDRIMARISGMKDGKENSEEYEFKRVGK